MENMLSGFGDIIQIIADTLNVSVEFVKQNGMEYLLEFGRYSYISSIPSELFIGLVIAILICLVIAIVVFGFFEFEPKTKKAQTITTTVFIIIFTVSTLAPLGTETLKYKMSPRVYSIEKAYEKLQGR